MGATNHTTNYNLPQFVGSDKPTWLGDINGAMSSIDTQMKSNADLGSSANTKADTALTNAQTAQTTASGAQTTAETAQTTATSALNKSLANEAEISKLNLTDFKTIQYTDMTTSNGSLTSGSITIAKDSSGSIAKVYGTIFNYPSTTGNVTITIPNTGLTPDTNITINNAGVYLMTYPNFSGAEVVGIDLNIMQNGTMTIALYASRTGGGSTLRAVMMPQLYFLKDFGDTPQPNP